MTLEELIDALERTGQGCGLISDDAGHWAVSTSGMQSVPMNPPEDISTSFFVEAVEWKPTIREALQAYYDEHVAGCESCRFWLDVDEKISGLGSCHRYPPRMGIEVHDNGLHTIRPQDGGWPMTFPEDWCGEHAARKPDDRRGTFDGLDVGEDDDG